MAATGQHRLIGRANELQHVGSLLDRVRHSASGVLVVRGEPGIGKSALLDEAAAMSVGMRLLRARGVESESNLPFGALVQLVRPIEDRIAAMPEHLADALRGALGMAPPTPGPPLRVGVAVLELLAAVAQEQPLLVLVDDTHWVDEASAAALLFAARRLGAEAVAMLFAIREGDPRLLDGSGLDDMLLDGIDVGSASLLVQAAASGDVAEDVCVRLHAAMRGNPLALIEGARLLGPDERSGRAPLRELPLPGARIERAFSRRISGLGAPSSRALIVVAAANGSDAGEIATALEGLGLSFDDLNKAEAAGIVVLRDGRLDFTHPLLRAAAYHAAAPFERRAAHAALASALADRAPARSVHHLAASVTGTNEVVAAQLERAAFEAAARSAPLEAARTLASAARLSPDPMHRAERLLAASRSAARGADFILAGELAHKGLAQRPDLATRAALELQLGVLKIATGSAREACDELTASAERTAAHDPHTAALMLAMAGVACMMQGRYSQMPAITGRSLALGRQVGGIAEWAAESIHTCALIIAGAGSRVATTLVHLEAGLRANPEYRFTVPLVIALPFQLLWIDQLEDADRIVRRWIAEARMQSAPMSLPRDLATLAGIELQTGDLTAAYADASEAIQLARDTRQPAFLTLCLVTLARVEALQGREQDCRSHVEEALAVAARLGIGTTLMGAGPALGLLELGLSRPDAAVRALEPVAQLALAEEVEEPNFSFPWQADLIEAYIRCGCRAEAERELDSLECRARRTGRTSASAAALRCRGLLAPTADVDALFGEALKLHAERSLPIERARTELCWAERLRRAGRRADAREPLRRAHDTFDRIGAHAWTSLVDAELRATGARRARATVARDINLTAKELQVSRLVAAGATNAEAAVALFLSAKTVEKHLTSSYRKLGVRSRSELARQFRWPAPEGQ